MLESCENVLKELCHVFSNSLFYQDTFIFEKLMKAKILYYYNEMLEKADNSNLKFIILSNLS